MGQTLTPVVRNVLIACVAVFVLQMVLGPVMIATFALWPPNPFVPHFEPFIASCDGYGREPEVRLTQLPPPVPSRPARMFAIVSDILA